MRGSRTHSSPDQLLLITPPSDWQRAARLPDVPRGLDVAIDTETRDDGLAQERGPGWVTKSGWVAGFSVAWRAGGAVHKIYVPVRHPDTENFDPGEAFRWLQAVIDAARTVVFHHQQYDEGWLSTEGVVVPEGRTDDTQSMAVMLDENWDSYRLDDCCRRAGVSGKDERGLREAAAAYGLDPKKDMWRLPARYVGPYAEQDAVATLDLRDVYMPQIAEQGLTEAYRLEMDLVPAALEMRRRGIRVDESAAERVQRDLRRRRDAVLERARETLGWRSISMEQFNSGKQLQVAFDQQKLSYPKTPKTGVGQFKAEWLEAQDHWLPLAVREARQLNDLAEKFIGTYVMESLHVGRIHSEIHLLRDETGGTRSYRLSYSNPPLQQMPARDPELAPLIRGIFLAERGQLWCAEDYSQQEPRIGVHLASICRVAGAQAAVDYYVRDPGADFHQMVADLTGISRKAAKIINLGLMYGMGLAKLARSLGVSIEEAEAIIAQYNDRMPWVKELEKFCESRAKTRGVIRLLDDARCRFDKWEPWGNGREIRYQKPMRRTEADRAVSDPDHDWYKKSLRRADTRVAMNRAIQGGAARQTKLAMRECWRQGIVPLVQLHDELDFSIGDPAVGERVREIMVDVVQLRVPMKVDVQYGHTWGQASQEPKEKGIQPPTWDELQKYGPLVPSSEIIDMRS